MSIATAAFRSVDTQERLPEAYVNAYYVHDLKLRIAVARVNDMFYAFDDLCSHDACPLSSGLLTGTILMCQCDGSQFDVTTGAVLRGPATEPLATYEVRVKEGRIEIRVQGDL
jgi:nitrite reductase/ring-hydroxylating ferredoxin subunit